MSFGNCLVRNRSEGPAHAAVLITVDERIIRYDLSALEVKIKSHFPGAQLHQGLPHVLLVLLLAKQKKEATSSCTGDLASQRAVPACRFVHLIDTVVGDFRGKPLLDFPTFVKQKTKFAQFSGDQRCLHRLS